MAVRYRLPGRTLVALLTIFLFLAPAYAGDVSDLSRERQILEKTVNDMIAKGDDVASRDRVNDIFRLGDILASETKYDGAVRYYEAGLKLDAARYEYQLKLANILENTGDRKKAADIARNVYLYAEDEQLTQEAERILDRFDPKIKTSLDGEDIAPRKATIANGIEIAIVPIGTPDNRLVRYLEGELRERIGIRFSIAEAHLEQGDFDRPYAASYVKDVYLKVRKSLPENIIRQVTSDSRMSESDMLTHYGRLTFIRTLLSKGDPNDLRQFNANVEELSKKGQHDVDRFVAKVRKAHPVEETGRLKGFLGIADVDLFAGDAHFVFAGSVKGYGVVSYTRFKGSFYGEKQNRPLMMARALKQAISSALFILDIPRCTTPNCVHAYPNSLTEHDQKSTEMCSRCRERLTAYIKING